MKRETPAGTAGAILLQSINPANGEIVWQGCAADAAAVNRAVARAAAALPDWSARPFAERAEVLRRFARQLESERAMLAELIAREIGKPWWEALTEVNAMIGKVAISIAAYQHRCAEFSAAAAVTRFRPHGVVAVIGPYNFPGHLPNGHICPALLAGNTVLFKPSELAPACAQWVTGLWQQSGLPDGVLQVLQGGRQTAETLCGHPAVRGVFFTGSAATGKLLAQRFANDPGKILALEMGGNNPLIVDCDQIEDLDAAVRICVQSAFISTGQRCTCARRLVLLDSVLAGQFIERLCAAAAGLSIGDPLAADPPFMGPLASAQFVAPLLAAQQARIDLGARPLLLARALRQGTGFISPGILDVSGVAGIADEELFGPVLQIIRVADLDAAIAAANASRFGLAAGMLTDSAERYHYAYARLKAGLINWNHPLTGASSAVPFGGIGDSGNHRPSAYFAADYCAHPVASIEHLRCASPSALPLTGFVHDGSAPPSGAV